MGTLLNKLAEEGTQLEIKIDKLSEFMHGDVYPTLTPTAQGLLMVQIRYMQSYASILRDRIQAIADNN